MTKDQQPSQGDVERVARALCAALGLDADEIGKLTKEPRWMRYAVEARAAIAALHSTSEGRVEQMREALEEAKFLLRAHGQSEAAAKCARALGGSNE